MKNHPNFQKMKDKEVYITYTIFSHRKVQEFLSHIKRKNVNGTDGSASWSNAINNLQFDFHLLNVLVIVTLASSRGWSQGKNCKWTKFSQTSMTQIKTRLGLLL